MKSLQIALMGWEHDRIVYGIKQKQPTKVIFISSDPAKSVDSRWGRASTSLAEQIGESIKSIVDYEIQYFNYHNLDESLAKTTELLDKVVEEYDEININISSGTTLLKMAFMLAANYYPIKLFYVIPAQYTHPGEIITTGARGLVDLPSINLSNITLPKKRPAEILAIIGNEPKRFTDIAKEYAQSQSLKLTKPKLRQFKAWIFYHIKLLEKQNLIETQHEENHLAIKLTQTGKFIKLIQQHKKQENEKQTKLKIKKKALADV